MTRRTRLALIIAAAVVVAGGLAGVIWAAVADAQRTAAYNRCLVDFDRSSCETAYGTR